PNELHITGPINLNGRNLSLWAKACYNNPANGSSLFLSGVVSGNGSVYAEVENCGGRVIVDGTQGNTFIGPFDVGSAGGLSPTYNGPVLLKKSAGPAVPGELNIVHGQVELGQAEQVASLSTVTVGNGSQFLLEGYNQ